MRHIVRVQYFDKTCLFQVKVLLAFMKYRAIKHKIQKVIIVRDALVGSNAGKSCKINI